MYHYIHHRVIAHNIVPGVVNLPGNAVLTFLFSPLLQNRSASLVTPWFLPLTRTLRVSLPEVALLPFFTSLSSLLFLFSPSGVRLASDQKAWFPLSGTFQFSSSVRGGGLLGLAFVNYICWSPLHFPASPPVSSFALRLVFWLLQLSHVLLAIFPTNRLGDSWTSKL